MKKENEDYLLDIYRIDTKAKLDKKKIILIVIIILAFLCIILTSNYIKQIVNSHKVYRQYEAQLNSLNQQEEAKKAKIEEEQKRIEEERKPKLTEVRKRQY